MYCVYIKVDRVIKLESLNLQPIVKEETTKERVYRHLKESILSGEISNDVIFTEVQLAELLNTSRTPVRESVQDLLREGILTSIPRKGLQVRSISIIEQEQIFLLRTSIETDAISKLTKSITDDQIKALKDVYTKQVKAKEENNNLKFIDLDQEFHMLSVKFLGYNLIEQVLLNLHELTRLIGLKALKKYGRMEEVLKEHESIISALEKRDSEVAIVAMKKHLINTSETLETIQKSKV